MKLSEAIRAGSAMSRQRFGGYISSDHKESCAIGAALLASGITARDLQLKDGLCQMRRAFPIIDCFANKENYTCMKGCEYHCQLSSFIFHLNDHHKMSREAIADVVANIENGLDPWHVNEPEKAALEASAMTVEPVAVPAGMV